MTLWAWFQWTLKDWEAIITIKKHAFLIISGNLELSEIRRPLFVEQFDSGIIFHTFHSEIKIYNVTNKYRLVSLVFLIIFLDNSWWDDLNTCVDPCAVRQCMLQQHANNKDNHSKDDYHEDDHNKTSWTTAAEVLGIFLLSMSLGIPPIPPQMCTIELHLCSNGMQTNIVAHAT